MKNFVELEAKMIGNWGKDLTLSIVHEASKKTAVAMVSYVMAGFV